ncbi:phosphomannomutase/phosphoglucomutase [Methanomicrobium sp. W14]|uniref:phosphoglucosamine mutase n=1 Tax=Methanomicrobium sp. W14 TaxID=2817839 RepID=UPI001AEA4D7D|nr:phosphoglucosamine mutase [Methanomicrobium sp. W14]MBP2132882.1 phosphomannomutase/phosphoglucomutase [Methanomicrobium sp. W14]
MSDNKSKKQLFGTNGVRGVIGESMKPELAMKIGLSLGTARKGKIAVGMDTRTSGPALINALKAGLLCAGCNVIDTGILPTPALQYLVKKHYNAGAMVTASHNPPEYNGIKLIEADGTEMDDTETIKVENILLSESFKCGDWKNVGSETHADDANNEYINGVLSHFPGLSANMTIAVDPGSGPACLTTPVILSRLGCTVHTINGSCDGMFPGRLPEPSVEGLKGLSELVRSTGAAFGVAHDGDADRAVFVDENGDYVEENEEFALMQRYFSKGTKNGIVVTPVSTSRIVEDIAKDTNCRVVYTKVGSIYVARKMLELKKNGENVVFGGEGNGGLIFPEHQHCRDGGMSAAAMVALLSSEKKKLSELRKELPERVMLRDKIYTEKPGEVIEKIKDMFSNENLDLTDGIRINRKDSWTLLRPSGTEPFMRLFVEAKNRKTAENFSEEIKNSI